MARLEGPAPAGAGDASIGEALFVGSRPLEQGGAPCAACHGIGGRGAPLSASFAPDLTDAFARHGKDALDDILTSQPFPSMAPIYASHPVTASERADLVAVLATTGAAAPAEGGAFALHAVGVAAFLLALLWFRRRRNGSARADLIARAAASGGHR